MPALPHRVPAGGSRDDPPGEEGPTRGQRLAEEPSDLAANHAATLRHVNKAQASAWPKPPGGGRAPSAFIVRLENHHMRNVFEQLGRDVRTGGALPPPFDEASAPRGGAADP